MSQIATAVIGVGYLGRFHAQKLKALPQSRLVGVVDANPERAKQVAQELGVEAYTQLEDVLPHVQAVSIAAPTTLHHALGLQCLNAGKHVLMEKPVASTSQEAAELAALAEKKKLILQVGFLERFNPAVLAVKSRVQKPRFIETLRISPFKERGHDVDVVLDLMIHDLDLIFSMVSAPLENIHAVGISLMTRQTDLANVRLMFQGGITASLTASRISNKAERKFRLFQEDGYFSLDLSAPSAKIFTARPPASPGSPPQIDEETLSPEKGDALLVETESFLQAIAGKTQPVATGREAMVSQEAAERIIQEIHRNRAS
ncbi:MAG: Gfo/Idh/MocA family oxidoreductase [Deltaproteobacteria bacterium]|nr:Gfo/Idh/MocA family oxidoreductase [Deltaproteobacteria bacterium]